MAYSGQTRLSAGRGRRNRREEGAEASGAPLRAPTLLLILTVAIVAVGWLSYGPTLAAAFGAAEAPQPPDVPAVAVLSGLTIGIDPGHGGFDPGVLLNKGQPNQIRETDINLALSLALRDILEKAGASVAMTRTEDTDLIEKGQGVRDDLEARVELINAAKVDLFISVHCNSFPSGTQWRGAQTFYVANGVSGSQVLAQAIQDELIRVTRETDRHPDGRQDLFILKGVSVPAVIIEFGFMSNPRDLKLLQDPDYQRLVTMAVFFGICRYIQSAPVGPDRPPGWTGPPPGDGSPAAAPEERH